MKLHKSHYSTWRQINSKNKHLQKRLSSRAVTISCGKHDMTVLIFRYSLLDLSLVQLTNIFMSDSNLPQFSDSSFLTVGQDKAHQLPEVFDIVATIHKRNLWRYFRAALVFWVRQLSISLPSLQAPWHSYQRSGSSICLPETLLTQDMSLISVVTVSLRRSQGDVFARTELELDNR